MEEKAQDARARAGLYRLLARMASQEPDGPFVEKLNAPDFRQAVGVLGLEPPAAPAPEEAGKYCEELAAEYARLFIVPGTSLHPYESVRRGEKQLWGDRTVEVQQAYHEAGFDLAPEAHQIPDHIAVELEFLAHLATEEAEQWEAGSREEAEVLRHRQKAFLGDHLGVWGIEFASALKEETSQPYFKFFAALLEELIQSDALFLDASLGERS